ncbi:hypothetical protein [Capnocytophaga stomatis]|uniref:Uncharacterized protein n=1 Tax=Capnocytophaga stomatis TaxID=1848904 RepID=A0ABW8QBA7_9FLAO|nr:hypothetical protein [Capnocytophaga stomatis]GIJ94920.1 hypothetical protein CAPN002_21380 [Capnocytophaga stomatis]
MKFRDDKFYRLTDNYAITKGYIDSYFVGGKVSIPTMGVSAPNNSVEYSYFVGEDFYIEKYSELGRVEIPDIKPDLSANYIVIYEKTIPDNVFKNYKHEKR